MVPAGAPAPPAVARVMAALEAAGTEQNRKVYPRHGVRPPLFGVSYADLRRISKATGVDHDLATALWATGNHDARVLATRVADPARLTIRQADAWARDCDNYVLVEAVADLVARSPIARSRADAWRDRRGEWVASAGWALVSRLAGRHPGLSGDDALALLDQIEAELQDRPNRVRHEMNCAVIALGLLGGRARERALEVAAAVGPVHVDHGRTGCRTPDAAAYILKTEARRAARRPARGGR